MKLLRILLVAVATLMCGSAAFAYVDTPYCNVTDCACKSQPCNDATFSVQSVPSLPGFEYLNPSWFRPTSLENASQDASYWINEVLPYPEHRNYARYLVIPTMGLVVGIGEVGYGTDDYWKMRNGQQIDINKYLSDGVVRFPHSGYPGVPGNMFVFGHSNGLAAWDGEFNSVFAKVMGLEPNIDQIWIFEEQVGGSYELFKYKVTQSFETTPENVDIMLWDGDGVDLTLSACTNKLAGRWIIKAEMLDEWADLDLWLRDRIDIAIKKISWLPEKQQTAVVVRFFKALDNARDKGYISDAEVELIVDYIQQKLVAIFPDA